MRLASSVQLANDLPYGSLVASWNGLLPKQIDSLTANGRKTWQLIALTDDEEKALLTRYNDLIARIALHCKPGNSWWYTWSSSRDRFHSSILSDLELLTRFDKSCAQGLPNGLVFLCPDPYLANAMEKVAKKNGIRLTSSIRDRITWSFKRLGMAIKPMAAAVKVAGRSFVSKRRVGKNVHPLHDTPQASRRTIFVTWIRGKDLLENHIPTETYFGSLPQTVANSDHSVLVFGDTSDGLPPKVGGQTKLAPEGAVSIASFLTNWGIIKSLFRTLTSKAPINTLTGLNAELRPLVRRDFRANRASMAFGALMESSLTALVKDFRPTEILHMYENNPWERACAQAARSITPAPDLVGYMHCAVLPSHTKIVITEEEKAARPRPSRVVCTGDRARDIMVKFGGHSPEEISAGCALRQEFLADALTRKTLRKPIKNVLVVLEGLPNMSTVVKFAHQALDGVGGINTVIRPHPSFPFRYTLSDAGLTHSDLTTITISEHGTILDDFEKADLVIYKGSTAAMEAGYLGIPLVHLKMPNLLTDDPLFEVPFLKRVVETPEELLPAIQSFESMDDSDFIKQHQELHAYIDEYLTMPNEDNIQGFFPPLKTIPA